MSLLDRFYADMTQQAQELIAEERKPNGDLKKFDFFAMVICGYCGIRVEMTPGKKVRLIRM
jgi:hypothetical protein